MYIYIYDACLKHLRGCSSFEVRLCVAGVWQDAQRETSEVVLTDGERTVLVEGALLFRESQIGRLISHRIFSPSSDVQSIFCCYWREWILKSIEIQFHYRSLSSPKRLLF